MTTPGNPASLVPQDGLTRLVRRVEDLERRLRELGPLMVDAGNINMPDGSAIVASSGANITANSGATITVASGATVTVADGGAVTVIDGAGDTVATLGTIGGVVDIHAQSGATTMPLGQLAFAATGANDGGTSFTQSTLNTWQAGPMSLVVEVKTGRLYVEAGAVITVTGVASTSSQGVMSWNIAGPTTVGPSLQRGFGAGVINGASPVVPGFGQSSRGYLHTGLTPGTYTITDQYQTDHGASYVGRSLLVIPF